MSPDSWVCLSHNGQGANGGRGTRFIGTLIVGPPEAATHRVSSHCLEYASPQQAWQKKVLL